MRLDARLKAAYGHSIALVDLEVWVRMLHEEPWAYLIDEIASEYAVEEPLSILDTAGARPDAIRDILRAARSTGDEGKAKHALRMLFEGANPARVMCVLTGCKLAP